jgi:soluble lytic murein transglycosylase
LRNDWLLELGRRRDWAAFARDLPRFRMNDDREVTCYAVLVEHLTARPPLRQLRDSAVAAWLAEREPDDGCKLMAETLHDAGVISDDDIWRKVRQAAEFNRQAALKAAIRLISPQLLSQVDEALDKPQNRLRRAADSTSANDAGATQLDLIAVSRVAANDADAAAGLLGERWQTRLPPRWAAWAWAITGKNAAYKLSADAPGHFQRAWALLAASSVSASGEWVETPASDWSADTLAWAVRCALRLPDGAERWPRVLAALAALPAAEAADPAWAYWRAQALVGGALPGTDGDAQRQMGHELLVSLASPLHFYGRLAAEQTGAALFLPESPEPLAVAERLRAAENPGLSRALRLVGLGFRDEGRREWNFSLRGMSDRELLAAAQRACDAADWQLCINTSERTRTEIDVAQRYPLPFAAAVIESVRDSAVDAPYVLGLIRQETRFMPQLRSSVGASGLMQLMPKTARWLAQKLALPANVLDHLLEAGPNIQLGTAYLKLLSDDFGGSQAMVAAAYNAGPSRPRRWREGPPLAAAVWIENIPFTETRDYVKKVLANADVYATLMSPMQPPPPLSRRLGPPIAPRPPSAPVVNIELP